jgi:hypothetical protein
MTKLLLALAAAVLAVVRGKGVCNDLHRDCANWSKKGHCSGRDAGMEGSRLRRCAA